jgi:hypothetical protein
VKGETSCLACAAGSYANGTANTNCTQCTPGKYQGYSGLDTCGMITPHPQTPFFHFANTASSIFDFNYFSLAIIFFCFKTPMCFTQISATLAIFRVNTVLNIASLVTRS